MPNAKKKIQLNLLEPLTKLTVDKFNPKDIICVLCGDRPFIKSKNTKQSGMSPPGGVTNRVRRTWAERIKTNFEQ